MGNSFEWRFRKNEYDSDVKFSGDTLVFVVAICVTGAVLAYGLACGRDVH